MVQWAMPSTDTPPRIVAIDALHLRDCVTWALACHGPKANLNHIDVSGVLDMSLLFSRSSFDGDISEWNVSNVTNMSGMFERSAFTGDISRWNTARLRNASSMFSNSVFNGDLSQWNTSSLASARRMFSDSAFEGDVSGWNVSALKDCERMFLGSQCKSDLSAWMLPKDCKFFWMTNQKFQGVLPKMKGFDNPSIAYGRLMGEHTALRRYLSLRPFSHVHATLLMGLKQKPEWATTEMFKDVKSIQAIAKTLGVKGNAVHTMVMDRFGADSNAPESFAVDNLLLD